MTRIEELRERVAALAAEAIVKALSTCELEEARLNEEAQLHREAMIAADTTRRANDMAARVDAARAKAGKAYLVAGVDLVSLFKHDAPATTQLPGNGVLIVRSATPEASETLTREFEHKRQSVNAMLADLLCASVVDPSTDGDAGVILREFCNHYPDAAASAAGKVRELSGAKTEQDKRGRG